MKHRLCLATEPKLRAGAELTLNRDQSHYLGRVLRLQAGADG